MQLYLDDYFKDQMILQRDEIYKVYGYDAKGTKVTVNIEAHSASSYVDENGYFEVAMPKMANGGPYTIHVQGSGDVTISDVYFGDVFLLFGQSNMETNLARVGEVYEDAIQYALDNHSKLEGTGIIRQFEVLKTYRFSEDSQALIKGRWDSVTKESIERFSAVGFFFSDLYSRMEDGIHIGLVQTAIGGSPIEAWCDEATLQEHKPESLDENYKLRNTEWVKAIEKNEQKASGQWMDALLESDSLPDTYKENSREFCEWDTLTIPCRYDTIEALKGQRGIVWLKKEIALTKEDMTILKAGKPMLRFGYIIDMDDIWVNGVHIGTTYYQYPPRRYEIPSDLLREGVNTIAIRHIVQGGGGAFLNGKPYRIVSKGQTLQKNWRINLRGQWAYKLTATAQTPPGSTFFMWKPTALFYGMLFPLRRINVKGALWYQGESNVMPIEHQGAYPKLFEGMVSAIRGLFDKSSLPFVSCLLAGLGTSAYDGEPGGIARMRLTQMKGMTLPYVDVISAADLGEFNDIHPQRKKGVGKRMALAMINLTQKRTDSVSPQYWGCEVIEGRYVITIRCEENHLYMKKPTQFQLEWLDSKNEKQWTLMDCTVESNKIILEQPEIEGTPIKLYYGMEDFPRVSSLYGVNDMPVLPFEITL